MNNQPKTAVQLNRRQNGITGWNTHRHINRMRQGLIVVLSIIASPIASSAGVQIAKFDCPSTVRTGYDFTCKVTYNVSDGNTKSTGFGLKVHYDSSKLAFKAFSNTIEKDLISQDTAGHDDLLNFDQDINTDKYVNTAWAMTSTDIDINGWPGGETLPIDLFEVTFTLNDSTSIDETTMLKMSAIPAIGQGLDYGFEAFPHTLTAAPSFSWDIDGDGQTSFTSDGILIMRYLFDFRGDDLISGVIGENASLDATQIASYLDQNIELLDIDADGKQRPLTDGLMILRYLADFTTQETLLEGALSNTATRTGLDDILNYLSVFKD